MSVEGDKNPLQFSLAYEREGRLYVLNNFPKQIRPNLYKFHLWEVKD